MQMLEQGRKLPEQGTQISPEIFTTIVKTNIAGVFFNPEEEQIGNIIRLVDEVSDNFDPLNPSTWKNAKAPVKRYQVLLNPDSDEETTLLGLLRQVNNVRIDLGYGNGDKLAAFSEINQAYEKRRMEQEESIQRFYAENRELIKKVFADII